MASEISAPLVWVELGRKPAKYLINNLKLHNELFPNTKKFLIMNRKYHESLIDVDIEVIFIENLPSRNEIDDFQGQDKTWNGLQKEYWTNTTARFFALNSFMKDKGINKIVHLESDCVLLSSVAINKYFATDGWGMRVAKQFRAYGCASVLLVNQRSELEKFLDFTRAKWSIEGYTDMNALGDYVNESDQSSFLYSGNPIEPNCEEIFDGVTIGRFFLGGDARNSRWPFSARGTVDQAEEAFNPSKYQLSRNNQQIDLIHNSENLHLQNIHIHSKRIPNSINKLLKIIEFDGTRKQGRVWKLGHFDHVVFFERLTSFLQRRLFRKADSDPRYR
jgi:hypothetical protein